MTPHKKLKLSPSCSKSLQNVATQTHTSYIETDTNLPSRQHNERNPELSEQNQLGDQLKLDLNETVKAIVEEKSTLADFADGPITPVNLSIVSKPQQIDDEFQSEGHWHRRKDFAETTSRPQGDITAEQMFPRAKEIAQQEADQKYYPCQEEAKQKYIEKHGNVVGVVGQAGIGKTTTAKKWAMQALAGQFVENISFFFYVVVRYINFKDKMTFLQFLISSMLPEWNCTSDEATGILDEIVKDPNVFMIFDGLDEADFESFKSESPIPTLYSKSKAEHYLKHLAGGNLLPRARKIFTSRPAALYSLHPSHRPRFNVQILGLNPNSQNELGQQICGPQYNAIQKQMAENSNLFAYCYVPVNFIHTLNYIMNYSGDIQQISLTRVLSFTCSQYSKSDHLKGQEYELDKLAKLAWDGCKKQKMCFGKEFENAKIKSSTADAFLNTLVTKGSNIKLTILEGHKRKCFSHLIWQDFFAAVYLMMIMSLEELKNHYTRLANNRWEVVAKFAFGICDRSVFNELESIFPGCSREDWNAKRGLLRHLCSRIEEPNQEEIKRVCSWAHEANDAQITSTVSSLLPDEINFGGSTLLPTDLENLSFVLQHTQKKSMKKLDLSNNKLGNSGAKLVASCVHVAEEVNLRRCGIECNGVEQLSQRIECLEKPIKRLDLSENDVEDYGAASIANCIHNLEEADLRGCKIGELGVDKLSTKIKYLKKPMKRLCLSGNNIGNSGARSIARSVGNFEEVELRGCRIGSDGVKALSRGISKLNTPLKRLDLSRNNIGDSGAEAVSQCVSHLEVANLDGCNIGDTGIDCLSRGISALQTPMRILVLNGALLVEEGAASLAACVHNIGTLYINDCEFLPSERAKIKSNARGNTVIFSPDNR